jgi:ribosomal protein S18 acetylase RimI-like enzyme
MTGVALRSAGPGDLDEIIGVFLRCFRESYATRLPPRVSESFDDAEARSLWATAMSRPDRRVVVALSPDPPSVCGVVGFEADGPSGWVHSLYVDPAAQGLGVGRTLLDSATRRLARSGCTVARLWVFAANTPSVAFYVRQGWTPDGAERVEERFGENEIRLTQTLAVTT